MSRHYGREEGESAEQHATRLQELLELRDADLARLNIIGAESQLVENVDSNSGEQGAGLEEAEAMLASKSQATQSPMVLQLLEQLQSAAVYTDTPNHETNRKLWDAYAKDWAPDKDWVKRMAGHLPGTTPAEVQCLGDEWSDEASLSSVLETWLFPYLEVSTTRAGEVGSGGGRVSAKVVSKVRELVCFDISSEMLATAKRYLAAVGAHNVRFQHVPGDQIYPKEYEGQFDLVYSFDVFVHLDLHQMRKTLNNIWHLLRPGGLFFVSFANLLAPDGWRRFARQKHYSVGGFYFVSPDIARCLLIRAGFMVEKVSSPEHGNTYLNRDLLILARRPTPNGHDDRTSHE